MAMDSDDFQVLQGGVKTLFSWNGKHYRHNTGSQLGWTGRIISPTIKTDDKCSGTGQWWTPSDKESFSCLAISAECQTTDC